MEPRCSHVFDTSVRSRGVKVRNIWRFFETWATAGGCEASRPPISMVLDRLWSARVPAGKGCSSRVSSVRSMVGSLSFWLWRGRGTAC